MTEAVYRIHDIAAQIELEEKAHIINNIKYDQNGEYIQTLKGETVFVSYVLLSSKIDNEENIFCQIDNLESLPEDFENIFDHNLTIKLNNELYSYGVCLFNKWCGFDRVIIDKFITANKISDYIYNNSKSNLEFHERLSMLTRKLFWMSSLSSKNTLSFKLNKVISLNFEKHHKLLSKLPKNPKIGFHIYKALINRLHDEIPSDHFLKSLINAKLGKIQTQLNRMIGVIGYIADDQNIIDSSPITENILVGLTEESFFRTAIGARKGLVDKSKSTPQSGYLERTMVVNLSPVEINSHDCGTKLAFPITIASTQHAKSLINRFYKIDPNEKEWLLFTIDDIDKYIDQQLWFRSVITCNEPGFKICHKCFGNYNIKSPYVGILTGQYFSERLNVLALQ